MFTNATLNCFILFVAYNCISWPSNTSGKHHKSLWYREDLVVSRKLIIPEGQHRSDTHIVIEAAMNLVLACLSCSGVRPMAKAANNDFHKINYNDQAICLVCLPASYYICRLCPGCMPSSAILARGIHNINSITTGSMSM